MATTPTTMIIPEPPADLLLHADVTSPRLASEVLRESKSALLEKGWHKRQWSADDGGGFCAWGAIGYVEYGKPNMALWPRTRAGRHLADAVGLKDAFEIPIWNDRSDTTFDDVMDAYDLAEKRALIEEETYAGKSLDELRVEALGRLAFEASA